MTIGDALFNIDDAEAAGTKWGFNCGPAALAAVTHHTPDEVRDHMIDFEGRGYTSPMMMCAALRELKVPFKAIYQVSGEEAQDPRDAVYPDYGLVRIQWAGRWTNPGVPIRVRYRHTHWIGIRNVIVNGVMMREAFDINAMCDGGWISWAEWSRSLVPWLLPQVDPQADGRWWPTHCLAIDPDDVTR